MKHFDILFTGHLCYDEIYPYQAEKIEAPGSAVFCGAMAAVKTGKKIAAYTRIASEDEELAENLKKEGIETFVDYSDETTLAGVVHPSANVDERELYIYKSAGFLDINKFPDISVTHIHLAGINNLEFSMEYMRGVKEKCRTLSVDMQSFVRQVDRNTSKIKFADVANKEEIVALMDMVKLDIVEAKILTGEDDLEKAAIRFEQWGAKETLITHAEGVLCRAQNKTLYNKFSNSSIVGRTGRGDTTFAAYLSARLDHDIDYSLRFASALVSIKMENKGPFSGTMQDVYERMKQH
jgi:sugar/nucleoside kinase (ribokinase family)